MHFFSCNAVFFLVPRQGEICYVVSNMSEKKGHLAIKISVRSKMRTSDLWFLSVRQLVEKKNNAAIRKGASSLKGRLLRHNIASESCPKSMNIAEVQTLIKHCCR